MAGRKRKRIESFSDAELHELEDKAEAAMSAALAAVMEIVASRIERHARPLTAADKPEPGQPYISPDDLASIGPLWDEQVQHQLLPMVAEVYQDSAGRIHAGLIDASRLPTIPQASSLAAETHLAGVENVYRNVGTELWSNARTQLLEGFQQGESIDQLTARLRGAADITARNAELVARSAVIESSNAGSINTARASGLDMLKEWMATPDARTRPTHRAADGQQVQLDGQFTVGGFEADAPGDSNLPPEEKYRCRCTLGYILGPDDVADAHQQVTQEEQQAALPNTTPAELAPRVSAPAVEVPAAAPELTGMAAHVKSGVVRREAISGGKNAAKVERVWFGDGSTGVFKVAKTVEGLPAKVQQDAEELASHVLRALGIRAPEVYRASARQTYQEFLEGTVAKDLPSLPGEFKIAGPYYDSDQGRILGLADTLMQNYDRNAGNWLVGPRGELEAIDHGFAFSTMKIPTEAPIMGENYFATYLHRPYPDLRQWADTDLSPADIATTRVRLEALRDEFKRLGHEDWLDNALTRLDAIAPHAKGTAIRIGSSLDELVPAVVETPTIAPAVEAAQSAAEIEQAARVANRKALRERARAIQATRPYADFAAEVDQVVANAGGRWNPEMGKILTERADFAASEGVDADLLTDFRLAVRYQQLDSVRDIARRMAADRGLRPIGSVGRTTAYDPETMQSLVDSAGFEPGDAVQVWRAGHNLVTPDGEIILIDRAIVRAAPEADRRNLLELVRAATGEASDDATSAIARSFERTYGELRTEVTSTKMAGSSNIRVAGDVIDAAGRRVGDFIRFIHYENGKPPWIKHDLFTLDDAVQGSGFASRWNQDMFDLYRKAGFDRVEVVANIDIGGYTWALQGFDFKNAAAAFELGEQVLSGLAKYTIAELATASGLSEDIVRAATAEMKALVDDINHGVHVTPYQISQVGRQPGQGGRESRWLGKQLLLDTAWNGVKAL